MEDKSKITLEEIYFLKFLKKTRLQIIEFQSFKITLLNLWFYRKFSVGNKFSLPWWNKMTILKLWMFLKPLATNLISWMLPFILSAYALLSGLDRAFAIACLCLLNISTTFVIGFIS